MYCINILCMVFTIVIVHYRILLLMCDSFYDSFKSYVFFSTFRGLEPYQPPLETLLKGKIEKFWKSFNYYRHRKLKQAHKHIYAYGYISSIVIEICYLVLILLSARFSFKSELVEIFHDIPRLTKSTVYFGISIETAYTDTC